MVKWLASVDLSISAQPETYVLKGESQALDRSINPAAPNGEQLTPEITATCRYKFEFMFDRTSLGAEASEVNEARVTTSK